MCGLSHILAELLASDSLWPALVFLAPLVIMASLRTTGSYIGRVATEKTAESR